MANSYFLIQKTCPRFQRVSYYGVSWPAKHLAQDPFGIKEKTEPLSHSTVLLFSRRESAEIYAKMILTHYSLTGELPSRELRDGFQYDAWAWTERVMREITTEALSKAGIEIESVELQRVAELGLRSGVQFAVVEVSEPEGDRFRPPTSYRLEPVFLPLVPHPEVLWKKHLHQMWLISDATPDL